MNTLFILNIILVIVNFFVLGLSLKIKANKESQLHQQQQELKTKTFQLDSIKRQIQVNKLNIDLYNNQLKILNQQQKELEKNLKTRKAHISEYLDTYYKTIENNSEQAFDSYEKRLDEAYQQKEQEFKTETAKLKEARDSVQRKLDQLKSTYQAAAAAQLRQKEKQDKQKFYTIYLTDNEISDIAKLQEWKKDLFDPSIVSKVIWSTYIIKPTGDLCNRIVGLNKTCGIYKITNKDTGKVYIGQSLDISARIKTHVKCGLGIDTPPASANKLYKAMQDSFIWNWTFEVIEKCSSGKLNEREKYWIDFYQSDKIGYNSNKGIKNASKD